MKRKKKMDKKIKKGKRGHGGKKEEGGGGGHKKCKNQKNTSTFLQEVSMAFLRRIYKHAIDNKRTPAVIHTEG